MENNLELSHSVSTPMAVLAVMPETKAQVKTFCEMIRLAVDAGEINPLEVMARVKAIESVTKELLTDNLKELARDEAEKHTQEKSFDFRGFKVELAETGSTYDYEGCNDPVYHRLKQEAQEATLKLKERTEFLKSIRELMVIVDTLTGESVEILPPVKSSTSGLKFTLRP